MSQKTSGGIEDDYLKLKKEFLDLKAEHETTKSSNKKLSTENSKLRAKIEAPDSHTHEPAPPPGAPDTPQPTAAATPQAPASSQEEHHHTVKSWHPKFCPDSGCETRPIRQMKSEVACSHCGISLGEEEEVKRPEFGRCPNCGLNKETGGGYRRVA